MPNPSPDPKPPAKPDPCPAHQTEDRIVGVLALFYLVVIVVQCVHLWG